MGAASQAGPEYAVPLMPGGGQAPRQAWLSLLSGSAALLAPGVVSAFGFVLLTSNRWHLIDPRVGVLIVLFVQWQVLGLTIAKLGLDQVVFAATTENHARLPNIRHQLFRGTVPLAVVFSVLVAIVFDPWAGLVCLLSLVVDTDSVVIAADMNGRGLHGAAAIGNMLRYPLFFLLLFVLHRVIGVSGAQALGVFLITSVLRWLWLTAQRANLKSLPPVVCSTNVRLAFQQLLNYMVFRGDQLILSTALGTAIIRFAPPDYLQKYLFLAKYPELVAGVMVVVGAVFLPRLFVVYPIDRYRLWGTAVAHWHILGLYVLLVGAPIILQAQLWRGSSIDPGLMAAFGISALLALPSNVLTYSMIRQGYVRALTRNLTFSLALGLAISAVGYALSSPIPLVLTVPVQLFLFIVLGLSVNWGERTPLYD